MLFVHHTLIAALSVCAAWQDESPDTRPAAEPAPAVVADPMASFARMVGGEWRVTAQSGTSMYDAWQWGPGKHSMRVMTDGLDAAGNPWRELEVVYWHPGRTQVCLLSLHPDIPGIGRGVSEGTIKFEDEIADALFDLYQTGGRRKMGLRWTFAGPDKYHATLLEATGPDGLKPIAEWDFFRIQNRPATPPSTAEEVPKPAKHLKAFDALVGRTWEARGQWAAGDALHVQSSVEWLPLVDAIYARVLAPSNEGEPLHVLDTYLYLHVGTGALRCLALSNRGGVYEGNATVPDGGHLQLDLKGYEGDRVVPYVMRCDFEQDGAMRHRIWSLQGAERALVLDGHASSQRPR